MTYFLSGHKNWRNQNELLEYFNAFLPTLKFIMRHSYEKNYFFKCKVITRIWLQLKCLQAEPRPKVNILSGLEAISHAKVEIYILPRVNICLKGYMNLWVEAPHSELPPCHGC